MKTTFDVTHVVGLDKVLQEVAAAEPFFLRAKTSNTWGRLRYNFSVPNFGSKLPHLIVLRRRGNEQVYAIAILLEYRLLGLRSGIFVPADDDGDLTVFALPDDLIHATERMGQYLLELHARYVFVSLLAPTAIDIVCTARRLANPPVALRERALRRSLILKCTMDETLAQMGARTRRNLRLAARRVEANDSVRFTPDASLSEADFTELNRACAYPVVDAVAVWRYNVSHNEPHGFISGLRLEDGQWISLLGGRRLGDVSIVDWQMNRIQVETPSVGLSMRYFHMQHEIALGTASLHFNGGTPHSIQHAFLEERALDMLWARVPYRFRIIKRLVAGFIPASNPLKEMLTFEGNH